MDGDADFYACGYADSGGGRGWGESELDAEELGEFGGEEGGDTERVSIADNIEGGWNSAWKMRMGGPYPLHPFPVRVLKRTRTAEPQSRLSRTAREIDGDSLLGWGCAPPAPFAN